ncbi:DUF4190 domain-containing protein [Microcella indica]|uniref:DUF4190 domain-containing protein n=1 Tax=Microcella indica TaxID=2750620 RepID=UPI0015CF328B|nr:DUF4190 domain-containing protein [Microcella indica]
MNAEQPGVADGDTLPGANLHERQGDTARTPPRRPRRRTNPLAIAALILAVLLSPVAALFGHIALGQIARSQGRERGTAPAWIAVGLGYLWLVGLLIIVGAVLVALDGGVLPWP